MAIEGGKKPDKLIPFHLSTPGSTDSKRRRAGAKEPTPRERHTTRREALTKEEPLEEILRKEWKKKTGEDAPDNRNLSLDTIDEFRIQSRRAQSLRDAV